MHQFPHEKIQLYFDEVEKEEQRKLRITSLTDSLLSKTKSKLKLQTQQSRKEDNFNKKIEPMKRMKTFVNVERRMSMMNLLNNPDVLQKLNTFKNSPIRRKPNKPDNLIENSPRSPRREGLLKLVDDIEIQDFKRSYIPLPEQKNVESQNLEFDMVIKTPSQKYDTNFFYDSVLNNPKKPLNSPNSSKTNHDNQIKQFLQEQGLLDGKTKLEATYQNYYQLYKQKSMDIVVQAKLEASKRYRRATQQPIDFTKYTLSQQTQKNLEINNQLFRRHSIATSHQVRTTTQQSQYIQKRGSINYEDIFEKTPRQVPEESYKPPLKKYQSHRQLNKSQKDQDSRHDKQRVQSQFNQFSSVCKQTQKMFSQHNQTSQKLLKRMSNEINQVQKKYQNEQKEGTDI
ncbi:hypothetical protein pb186bvf_009310 [Paramecium bursaria]